jgi:glycosyltransferase involved in cell wall biosynthesis
MGKTPVNHGDQDHPEISLIVPAYNEEESILPLYTRLITNMDRIGKRYEIIFVDDGSTDMTLERMRSIVRKDPRVRIVTFWKNFGKANALSAGFDEAKGDIIIQMDADLQDDPVEIPRFLARLSKGYDMVVGWKRKRQDPFGKTIPSKVFNFLIRKISGIDVHDSNCGFKAYRREVMEHLEVYGEMHRYLPMIARWRGFRISEIEVKHHSRK